MNILLTTDFSYGSLKAANYIINLFGVKGHNYMLLNAANVHYAGSTFYTDFLADIDSYHEAELKKVVAELKEKFNGIQIKSHAEIGSLITAIDRHSALDTYSIIGLGANGSSNFYEKLIGSTALDVLDHCQLPIAIVPVVTQLDHPKKIMVAINKSFEATKNQFVNFITELAKQPAELFLYHIGEENEFENSALFEELKKELSHVKVTAINNPSTGASLDNQILEFATENDVDLLFTSPKDHNLIQRLFQHSTTDQLVERTHIPMIALKS